MFIVHVEAPVGLQIRRLSSKGQPPESIQKPASINRIRISGLNFSLRPGTPSAESRVNAVESESPGRVGD